MPKQLKNRSLEQLQERHTELKDKLQEYIKLRDSAKFPPDRRQYGRWVESVIDQLYNVEAAMKLKSQEQTLF